MRFDAASGTVAVRYHVAANIWRLHYLPYDEFKVLFDDDVAFPI